LLKGANLLDANLRIRSSGLRSSGLDEGRDDRMGRLSICEFRQETRVTTKSGDRGTCMIRPPVDPNRAVVNDFARGGRGPMAIRRMRRAVAYGWASPTTAVGVLAGMLTLASGGQVRRRPGIVEFHGGFSTWLARRGGFGAMTLGHVVLGRCGEDLDLLRDHEMVHVRQVERWGAFFLPAYLAASAWEWSRGRHYYLDNWFERDARRRSGEEGVVLAPDSLGEYPSGSRGLGSCLGGGGLAGGDCAVIKAVIFDVDGTLIDSVDFHAQAWQQIFSRYGYEIPVEKIRAQIGKGGDELMPVFLSADMVEYAGEAIEKERGQILEKEFLPRIKPFPKVRELFERIAAEGLTIVLASSAKESELERYEEIAGIEDLVDASTSSDDADQSKPNPDIFLAALERGGGLKPAEAVVIGDTPYDAEAAKKAGIPMIGVLSGGFKEADLRKAGCFEIYRDVAELLEKFDTSPLARPASDPA
jgi:HAD superfamily hydrolase (TIGR01509 family)